MFTTRPSRRRWGYLSLRRRVVQVRKLMPLINQSIIYQNSTQMNQRAGREGTGKVSPLTLLCQDARRLALGAEGANTRARHGGRQASAKCQRSRLSVQRESAGTLRGSGNAMNRDDACEGSSSRFAIETGVAAGTSARPRHERTRTALDTVARTPRAPRSLSLSQLADSQKPTLHPRDACQHLSALVIVESTGVGGGYR